MGYVGRIDLRYFSAGKIKTGKMSVGDILVGDIDG